MVAEEVLFEKKNGLAFLTFNRPEAHNAMNSAMVARLLQFIEQLKEEEDVKVVVLRGAGKSYCAGVDIKEAAKLGAQQGTKYHQLLVDLYAEIDSFPKPVLSSVHGYALGHGCACVAASDLAISSNEAILGMPEIDLGTFPYLSAIPLIRCLGLKKAFELLFTGRRVTGQEAERIGLVNSSVPSEKLSDATLELANILASKSTQAMRIGKETFAIMRELGYKMSLRYGHQLLTKEP